MASARSTSWRTQESSETEPGRGPGPPDRTGEMHLRLERTSRNTPRVEPHQRGATSLSLPLPSTTSNRRPRGSGKIPGRRRAADDAVSTTFVGGVCVTYTDQVITCSDCGIDFVFSASEQEFFAEKGFSSAPKRCASCRAQRRAYERRRSQQLRQRRRRRAGFSRGPREMHDATCARCGNETQVPFRPTGARPVYCSDCFRMMRD